MSGHDHSHGDDHAGHSHAPASFGRAFLVADMSDCFGKSGRPRMSARISINLALTNCVSLSSGRRASSKSSNRAKRGRRNWWTTAARIMASSACRPAYHASGLGLFNKVGGLNKSGPALSPPALRT